MRESTEPWAVAICHGDAVLDDLVATIADAGIGSEPVKFSGIHHESAVMAVRKACHYCLDYSDALDVDYSEVSKAIVDWTTTKFTHREVERVALHAINEVRRVPADAWKSERTDAKPQRTDSEAVQIRKDARRHEVLAVVAKQRRPARSMAALLRTCVEAHIDIGRDTLRTDLIEAIERGEIQEDKLPPLSRGKKA
tara:strand:- start:636 stop:1223 length:588 start_codon:yes stop_codon:yes gene_type:complete